MIATSKQRTKLHLVSNEELGLSSGQK